MGKEKGIPVCLFNLHENIKFCKCFQWNQTNLGHNYYKTQAMQSGRQMHHDMFIDSMLYMTYYLNI